MPIRIVHTADNHIGMPFRQHEDDTRNQLLEERFEALERLIETANSSHADFFIISGDLFDSTRVKMPYVERTVDILNKFTGTSVLVLPGNHDFYAGDETEVWKRFHKVSSEFSNIQLLTTTSVVTFEVSGETIQFFPCPCPSKTGKDPIIAWIADAEKNLSALRIGIAHGNVNGLGLDTNDRYFTMTMPDLEAIGLTTWLLGHIHVPFPTTSSGSKSQLFMAGTHTPDSVRCKHPGSAWLLEFEESQLKEYKRLSPGKIRFVRISQSLHNINDISELQKTCDSLDPHTVILDLKLSGQLSTDEQNDLHQSIQKVQNRFRTCTVDLDIKNKIDSDTIATLYPKGTLAERLLSTLLADDQHPHDVTLAHDLIREISSS